ARHPHARRAHPRRPGEHPAGARHRGPDPLPRRPVRRGRAAALREPRRGRGALAGADRRTARDRRAEAGAPVAPPGPGPVAVAAADGDNEAARAADLRSNPAWTTYTVANPGLLAKSG